MSDKQLDLSKYLGGDKGPYKSWDTVTAPMIRHWCEAMDDNNPIYTDRKAAVDAGFEGVVAPPTMMQAWTMYGYGGKRPPGSDERNSFEVVEALKAAGYPAVVAVNCEQEYDRLIVEGDDIYHRSTIESISEEKNTALGVGYFVTELSTFYNQRDEKVGTMRFRVFLYRPHEQMAPKPSANSDKPKGISRIPPLRNHDTAFFWEGVDADEIRVQRCKSCKTLRHPPSPVCPSCQSLEWDYTKSSGRGTVYSFTVMHYPEIPPFDYPNIIALVELDEGTRLVTNLVGVKRNEVKIGLPVVVCFEEVDEGLRLHQFKPAEEK